MEKVLENIPNEPYQTMPVIAICLGLRVSELLALKRADLDFKYLTIRVSRKVVNGGASRVKTEFSEDDLLLDPSFAEWLLHWQRESPKTWMGWMFPNPASLNPFWASGVQKDYLVPAGQKTALPNLGWHAFRHTYRSFLDAADAPLVCSRS